MYTERLNTLTKVYKSAKRSNELYESSAKELAKLKAQIAYVSNLNSALHVLARLIMDQEKQWQEKVLRGLEAEIMEELSFVYPNDGYKVQLSSRILRGKIHIEASVSSHFTDSLAGDIEDTQGGLFQQIVSFAALVGIMQIYCVNTIYIDEAFSDASPENVDKLNSLLCHLESRGINIILIAQNTSISLGTNANILYLTRCVDNKTQVGGSA